MSRSNLIRIVVLLIFVGVAVIVYQKFGQELSLSSLAERETQLRDLQSNRPLLVLLVAFFGYVVVTGLSLPGAAVLTLTSGWYFGFWKGMILVSFASTTGATIAFLLSRFLFRESLQNKFGDRLVAFNENLQKEGPFYLFSLRLIPAVPFFVINVVMGLTKMKTSTFWWVSQIGMLAGTAVYVGAGASVPSLSTLAEKGVQGILSPQLIVAFVILGIFPLVARKVLNRFRSPADPLADA